MAVHQANLPGAVAGKFLDHVAQGRNQCCTVKAGRSGHVIAAT